MALVGQGMLRGPARICHLLAQSAAGAICIIRETLQ